MLHNKLNSKSSNKQKHNSQLIIHNKTQLINNQPNNRLLNQLNLKKSQNNLHNDIINYKQLKNIVIK